MKRLLLVLLIAASVSSAFANDAQYAPWGVDEYEFFGLTKPQLAVQFKNRVEFREEFARACVAPQNGLCSGYDGPTFDLTFTDGRVSKVRRVFVGCKETQYGPELESKPAALRYFISNIDAIGKRMPLNADLQKKLAAARGLLNSTSKTR